MADRIITVTNPSIVTNDTLASYNNYTNQPSPNTLIGSMTPTEATNGKTVALSDGVVHEVTTKPVGATNGEFTAVVSNAVTVDLSSQTQYKIVTSASPDNDQLRVLSTDRPLLEIDYTTPFSTSINVRNPVIEAVSKVMIYGSGLLAGAFIRNTYVKWGLNDRWDDDQADIGATVTIGDFLDTVAHDFVFSWTPGDAGLKLSIDGYDFGFGGNSSGGVTENIQIYNMGSSSTFYALEFQNLILNRNGAITSFLMNEGSGAVSKDETDTYTLELVTSNAGGLTHINSVMWQTV